MIHAAGFVPVRISGGATRIEKANTLVPSFVCPYLRASLEHALNGRYDYLAGVITAYTCDAACGMINIWEENVPAEFFHTIPLPYHTNGPATAFFRETMRELAEGLAAAGGKIDDSSLARSLDLFGEIRALLRGASTSFATIIGWRCPAGQKLCQVVWRPASACRPMNPSRS